MKRSSFLYCPALRMKAGELAGVRELAEDVASCTLPRFIVPPPEERDGTQHELFAVDKTPDISSLISRHWYGRAALIDSTYLLDECGRERIAEWLPQMFSQARKAGVRAIPMAGLSDLGAIEAAAFRAAISSDHTLKFAISVSSDDMVGPSFQTDLKAALTRLDLAEHDCAVIADFHAADFSDPELVAPIINGTLELLQDLGLWQHVIFQGTHYPENNPAGHDAVFLWPRNEWIAWKRAVNFDPSTAANIMFGDYAADCAKIAFGGSGGAPIKHYRYTTQDDWLVVRGPKDGKNKAAMQRVCQKILVSGKFDGPSFSTADAYIHRTAMNQDGPGNPTTWRQVNTTHHITRVVVDLGKVRGVSIAEQTVERANQMDLLDF
ncbi:beta family protein [Polycyclovorans algicola]|uniref:beta family protein n=1 Tax=Polycyclovorans algicola TaxID=616992 RepID=UPI0004A70862|nr:beta family protein [Polycyclovorans algicola]